MSRFACAAVGVALLAGRNCLRFAGIVFEPDTGANSAVAAPPAPAAQAAPVAPAAPIAGAQAQSSSIPGLGDQANFLTQLGNAFAAALTPISQGIQQQNAQINQTLQSLMKPAGNAQSQLFGGGAPNVQVGESVLNSRGYEFGRAIGLRMGQIEPENCKHEQGISEKLRKVFCQQGGLQLQSASSLLVPLGSDLMPPEIEDEFRLEIAQMQSASVAGVDPSQLAWMRQKWSRRFHGGVQQALSQFDDTGLGNLLGPTQHGEMIDLLRNKEVFTRAGATDFALPPNGRIQFNRMTGAMTAYWIGETPSDQSSNGLTASTPTSGEIQLSAKKLACLVKYPNELLRFGGPTIEALLRNDMTQVMALKADSTMLTGVGTTVSPKGLLRYSINALTAGVVATDGNQLQPEDLGLMINMLEEDNIDVESDGFTWLLRSWLHWDILNRRTTPYSGGTNGEWIFQTNRQDVANGMPMRLLGFPCVRSNQIPNDRTKGSGTYGSCLIGGAFKHWLIGRVGVMEFTNSTQGDTPFVADQTWLKAIQYMDAAPRYEEAFVYCDTLVRN